MEQSNVGKKEILVNQVVVNKNAFAEVV